MATSSEANGTKKWFTWRADRPEALLDVIGRRANELSVSLEQLRKLNHNEVIESDKYYPIRFFSDGIMAYIYSFDNAAIYYVSLALEIALITRLGEPRLNQTTVPKFSDLIRKSRVEGILDSRGTKLANRVRKMRNGYIHYFNIMWHQRQIDVTTRKSILEMYPLVKEEILRLAPVAEQTVVLNAVDVIKSSIEADQLIAKRAIVFQGIRPNLETIRFLSAREEMYRKWLSEAEDQQSLMDRWNYGVERQDALECIGWCAAVLSHTGFLPA